MKDTVQIVIDGKTVEAPVGSTILEVARKEGIHIPVLCYSPLLRPLENCRLCVVAVTGEKQYKAACSTQVTEGMEIITSSEELTQTRKLMLELLLDNHYGDCVAPCTVTCPANVDIQGYLACIRNGEYREAVEVIKRNLPMPLTIGRVCPHPCESQCRRHLVEEPININHCKRFVADYEMARGNKVLPKVAADSGKRVAIVGGGPAGLSVAYYLRSMGHGATIYEAKDKLGGMLRYGIPEYRLPKQILDWEIEGIISLGVNVKYNMRWGKDFTLEDLKKEGYDAIFLGIGAWASNRLELPGEELEGVLSGIEFLDQVAEGQPPKLGRHVIVVGGGNTAIDAARTSLRLGAEKVTILYRRSRKEMPANPEEIHAAEHEKVHLELLAAPIRLLGDNGKLKQIEYIRMELGEPDASGRRRPVPVAGSETMVDVDQVINAIGQAPALPSMDQDATLSSLKITRWNTFAGDEASQHTGTGMIFSGGDVFRGPMTVVAALADGRKAAYAMDAYFCGGEIRSEPMQFNISKGKLKNVDPEPLKVIANAPRERMPELAPEIAVKGFEAVELGFSEDQAQREANRCLVCGCSAGFDCRLRDLMTEFNVQWRDQTDKKIHYTTMAAVDSHPLIALDPNKCIRCQRCHVACATFQCSDAIDLKDYPSINERCVECGLCVDLCPTGALMVKRNGRPVDRLNWQSVLTHCVNCGFGCELDLKVRGDRLIWIGDGRMAPPSHSSTCKRGRFRVYDELWYGQRVTKPMIRANGSLQEATWDEAVAAAVAGFRGVQERHGASAVAAVGSPQATSESLYLLQKWLRAGWQSHGLDFPGRDNHERLLDKMEETIGFRGMTQELSGLDRAAAIFVCGDDIEEVSPVVATSIRRAARQRQVPVCQLSTRPDGLTPLAAVALHVEESHWAALLRVVLARLAESGRLADDMVTKAGLKPAHLKDKLAVKDLAGFMAKSGVDAAKLEQLAAGMAQANSIAFVFPENLMGRAGDDDPVLAIVQLAALTGNLGTDNSGGLYPLSPGINVHGASLLGFSPNYLPGFVKIGHKAGRKVFADAWGAPKMPASPSTAPFAALDGQLVKGLLLQNAAALLRAEPDAWRERLAQLECLVVLEQVPGPALDIAHVVLPTAAFGEQDGFVVNQERRVLRLQQAFKPCGEALADWQVVARLMTAQGIAAPNTLADIHGEISQLVSGFAGFPWASLNGVGVQLPWNKEKQSGTPLFDPAGIKKMKLGI